MTEAPRKNERCGRTSWAGMKASATWKKKAARLRRCVGMAVGHAARARFALLLSVEEHVAGGKAAAAAVVEVEDQVIFEDEIFYGIA